MQAREASDTRNARLARGLRNSLRDGLRDAAVKGAGDDVRRTELVIGDKGGDRLRGGDLHRVVDVSRADVQRLSLIHI